VETERRFLSIHTLFLLSALSGRRLVGLSISSLKQMDQFTPNVLQYIGAYAESFPTYGVNTSIIYCDLLNRIQLNIKKWNFKFCPYVYSMGAGMAQSLFLLVTHWQPRSRSSRTGWVKNILFFISSKPALGPTQSPIEWIRASLTGIKAAGTWHLPLTSEVKTILIHTSTVSYVFMTYA
jgi:hypothetical protein